MGALFPLSYPHETPGPWQTWKGAKQVVSLDCVLTEIPDLLRSHCLLIWYVSLTPMTPPRKVVRNFVITTLVPCRSMIKCA